MENPPKIIEVVVTPELADRYKYSNNHNCALFHAMWQHDIPVYWVGRTYGLYLGWATFRIEPPFGEEDYARVRETREPFRCLIVPE